MGSYTLVVAPIGLKFGTEEGTRSLLLRAKFRPINAMCRPCGAKNLKSASE